MLQTLLRYCGTPSPAVVAGAAADAAAAGGAEVAQMLSRDHLVVAHQVAPCSCTWQVTGGRAAASAADRMMDDSRIHSWLRFRLQAPMRKLGDTIAGIQGL